LRIAENLSAVVQRDNGWRASGWRLAAIASAGASFPLAIEMAVHFYRLSFN
jgi:hypothetical protein